MELKWLEDYLSLCNSGNFCISSKQRFVSQPAFSRRIKALETWVGAELIDRSSYPVQPSEVGQEFKLVAQQIVSLAYQTRNDIRAQTRDSEGRLCFSTLITLAQFFISPWLKKLQPYIDTELFSVRTDFRSIDAYLTALEEGVVDFFIYYDDMPRSMLIDVKKYPSMKLGVESLIPVTSPDKEGKPNWWLPDNSQGVIPYLHCNTSAHLDLLVNHHLKKRHDTLIFNSVYEGSTSIAVKSMVIEGYGVAWLPESVIIDDLANGRLVRAAEKNDDILVDIKIFRYGNSNEPRVEKFWQALSKQKLAQTEDS